MNLRQIALVLIFCSALLALVCYETYRNNASMVAKLAGTPESAEMFIKLEAGIPMKSKITGFFAVMLGVAGGSLLVSSRKPTGIVQTDDQ